MLSPQHFVRMKEKGEKIVMVTAYDYPAGKLAAESADCILVGDSYAMVVLGKENTLDLSVDEMLTPSAAVRRGAPGAFVIADLPYLSYHAGKHRAIKNAGRFMQKAGVNAVKLEGGTTARLEVIAALVDAEIPVVAHLGLTPQSLVRFGGYKVQGVPEADAEIIMNQAVAVEKAGAFMLVAEGVPEELGGKMAAALKIPVIGIGAGRRVDGQVLVWHDMLGYSDFKAKFVKVYADINTTAHRALEHYASEVREGVFPAVEHVYYPADKEQK